MTEIPEDVMKLAGDVLGAPDVRVAREIYDAVSLRLARAILAEREAQRERDAKIALTALRADFEKKTGNARGPSEAELFIAAAIRNPCPPTPT